MDSEIKGGKKLPWRVNRRDWPIQLTGPERADGTLAEVTAGCPAGEGRVWAEAAVTRWNVSVNCGILSSRASSSDAAGRAEVIRWLGFERGRRKPAEVPRNRPLAEIIPDVMKESRKWLTVSTNRKVAGSRKFSVAHEIPPDGVIFRRCRTGSGGAAQIRRIHLDDLASLAWTPEDGMDESGSLLNNRRSTMSHAFHDAVNAVHQNVFRFRLYFRSNGTRSGI